MTNKRRTNAPQLLNTEEILANVKNGERIVRHTVRYESGTIYEQHYRDYPKSGKEE